MEQLHPGAKWWFRIEYGIGFIIVIIMFLSFIFTIYSRVLPSYKYSYDSAPSNLEASLISSFKSSALFIFIFLLIVFLIFVEVFARLAYRNFKFEIKEDSINIERGIIWKNYSLVPYERVQNIDIHRGIFGRLLGFSSLSIQTAGYSGTIKTEGELPALSIERAEQIRKFILNKTRRNQGI